jgi:hypothetical protein
MFSAEMKKKNVRFEAFTGLNAMKSSRAISRENGVVIQRFGDCLCLRHQESHTADHPRRLHCEKKK